MLLRYHNPKEPPPIRCEHSQSDPYGGRRAQRTGDCPKMPIRRLLSSLPQAIQGLRPALKIFRPRSRSLLDGKLRGALRNLNTAQRTAQVIQDLVTITGNAATVAEEINSKKPNGDKPPCDPSAGAGSNPSPTPDKMPVQNDPGVGTNREIGPPQWMKFTMVLMGFVIAIVGIFSLIFLAMNGSGTTAIIISTVGILGGIAWGVCCVWIFWGRRKLKSSDA